MTHCSWPGTNKQQCCEFITLLLVCTLWVLVFEYPFPPKFFLEHFSWVCRCWFNDFVLLCFDLYKTANYFSVFWCRISPMGMIFIPCYKGIYYCLLLLLTFFPLGSYNIKLVKLQANTILLLFYLAISCVVFYQICFL